MRRHCLGQQDRRRRIDAPVILQRLRGDVLGPVHLEDRGRVDQNVDTPHISQESFDSTGIGEVKLNCPGRASCRNDVSSDSLCFSRRSIVMNDHMPTVRTQGAGDFGTQALAAAGYERNPVRHEFRHSSIR